ncbi:MAG: toxin-antitoxin system YwqK family antitoxin [Cyclobacteriaceae bacterium]|nr:toxin-antitoxin system YwqK family antitoxin [Cyclobacteriaceae bacterium HetDA_MAG_MS6]
MTREEHLVFCRQCHNRKFDPQQGLVCSLTDKIADFEDACESFDKDDSVKEKVQYDSEELSHSEVVAQLSDDTLAKLKPHQDLVYATVGGFFLSVICALIWAVITVTTEYQIAYMAIGVGLAVGMGVRFFGAGVDPIFGYIGAFFALLGCLLGNLFSQVGFIAQAQSLGYFETLTLLDIDTIILIYQESFSIIDLLFYGFAVVEGYKFAFRSIPKDINTREDLTPENSKLRLPLVIASFVIIAFAAFRLSKGIDGEQTFYYESGQVLSTGEYVEGKEQGLWKYYYESGRLQAEANYASGVEQGKWIWYYESGEVMRNGSYENGLFDGYWANFNAEGVLVDSSNYSIGRRQGAYASFYDDGRRSQLGSYERDKEHGPWILFYPNGNKSAEGSFENGEMRGPWTFWSENGKRLREADYRDSDHFDIRNAWDMNGRQLVKNGNGEFKSFFVDGSVERQGMVVDGKHSGEWKEYYTDGSIKEVGLYEGDRYKVLKVLGPTGEVQVENGVGRYVTYQEGRKEILTEGSFKEGLKDGVWTVYFDNTDLKAQEANYLGGQMHGESAGYYNNGVVSVQGSFDNGKQEGEWNWYYETGQIQCTANFENGLKSGAQFFWSESGYKVKEEIYEQGELIAERML